MQESDFSVSVKDARWTVNVDMYNVKVQALASAQRACFTWRIPTTALRLRHLVYAGFLSDFQLLL